MGFEAWKEGREKKKKKMKKKLRRILKILKSSSCSCYCYNLDYYQCHLMTTLEDPQRQTEKERESGIVFCDLCWRFYRQVSIKGMRMRHKKSLKKITHDIICN